MRNIKFRAWNKEWRWGGFNPITHEQEKEDASWMQSLLLFENPASDNYELMQYTGFKDKNGIEIYEGDIVKTTMYKGTPNEYNCYFMVCRNEWSFYLTSLNYIFEPNKRNIYGEDEYVVDSSFIYDGYSEKRCGNSEILGNKYENKNLLGTYRNAPLTNC